MAYNDVRTPEAHAAATGNATLDPQTDVIEYSVGHIAAAQMHGWEAHKRATTEAFTLLEGYYLEAITAALAGSVPYASALSPYAISGAVPPIGPGKHLVESDALLPWVTFEDLELPASSTQVFDYVVRAYGYLESTPTTRVTEVAVVRVTRDGSGNASLLSVAAPFVDSRLRVTVGTDDITVDVRAHATEDWIWDTEAVRQVSGSTLSIRLSSGDTVAASGIDSMQSGAGGRLAVDSLGQRFPRRPPLFDLIDGLPNECSGVAAQVLAEATGVFLFRQQDRYTDTGQIRSRAWNDSAQYLILGETGDACPQLWFNGLRGVKTAASATSCIRIPNAYIDPDAAFSITILMAVRSSSTTPSNRPSVVIGSQHGDVTQARVVVRQNTTNTGYTMYNASAIGFATASFTPYAFTISASASNATFWRDGVAGLSGVAKIAGTIYTDDHAIGGWWNQAGGVWQSYEGFYVLAVLIHSRELTSTEVAEVHAALTRPEVQNLVVHVGQSNTGSASLVGASPITLPNYAHAMCDTYSDFPSRGWGPVNVQPYAGVTPEVGQQVSPTQGFASVLPTGHAHVKVSLGGQGLTSFYDDGAICIELQENMMRALFQLGCRTSLKYIVVVSCESEADVSTPADTVRTRLYWLADIYRMGFEKNLSLRTSPRVVVSILNSQYKLGIAGAALVRAGEIAFVAADGNARSFDSNAVPLDFGDNVHWLGVSRILVGIGLGTAALT